MPKFEAHITCPREQAEAVKACAEAHNENAILIGDAPPWSFSQIDGDPVMGKQAYCYLTRYHTDGRKLFAHVSTMAAQLELAGVEVLRRKIERILYDSKTTHDDKNVAAWC